MATVFTFDPAFFPLRSASGKEWLGGELYRDPHRRVHVKYNNNPIRFKLFGWDGTKAVKDGAAKLDLTWRKYTPPFIFFGHSMGGQLLNYWLRHYGPTSDLDPADALFIATGDMEQRYNGASLYPGSGYIATYDGSGIPEDNPYPYICANRQYDIVGDYPNNIFSLPAILNIQRGQAVHMDYSMCSLYNPNNRSYSPPGKPHIQYTLFPTYPVQRWEPTKWDKLGTRVRDAIDRAQIEAAYDRPMDVVDPSDYVTAPLKKAITSSYFTPFLSPARTR